jgi:hypothetical protein
MALLHHLIEFFQLAKMILACDKPINSCKGNFDFPWLGLPFDTGKFLLDLPFITFQEALSLISDSMKLGQA